MKHFYFPTSYVIRILCYLFFSFMLTNLSLAQPTGFVDEVYASGFAQAVGLTFDANGRMYVWEKGGKVWTVENGVKSANPLIDLSEEVGNWRDFGFLGFALDPDFFTNGYIYMLYIVDRHHLLYHGTPNYDPNANEYFNATIGRVTRYTAQASTNFTTVDPNSRLVLLGESISTGLPHLHQSHGIGSLIFGTDGTLLVSMGDGASYSSTDEGSASETYWSQALADGIIAPSENVGAYRCQMLSSLNGKILRLDPSTGDGIPSNPYYDGANPRSAQSRVWALGLRNPCRMTLQPNTGSHNPADGDPGTLYIGDVGWGNREELNICDAPGQNFGWPKYEGVNYQPGYNNPTYAPASHELPKVQWRTNKINAQGIINGTVYDIGSPQLPGPNFGGNCSMGGVWYTGSDFPTEYQNTYFHADYGGDWIKNFDFNGNNDPIFAKDFKAGANAIVFVGSNPLDGAIYWIGDAAGSSSNGANVIHKISYNPTGNLPPVAVASSDISYGGSSLTVQFNSEFSYDPEGSALSYAWDFGDGNSSSVANPMHTFAASGSGAETFTAVLTVTDGNNQTDQDELIISLNNSPPNIVSTSLDGISTFSHNSNTTLNLSAVVNDAEHANNQLSYEWQYGLYHNDHNHNEPSINSPTGSAMLTPVGCDGITYWYRISLTLTDPEGLSSTVVKDLYPDCNGTSQSINFPVITDKLTSDPSFSLNPTSSSGLDVNIFWISGPATISGNNVFLNGNPGLVTIRAVQGGNGSYQPAVPVERTFAVRNPPPPVLKAENGVLTEVSSNWQTVNLDHDYNNMVVVATPTLTDASQLPAVTRIRNASGNSFELKVQNPSDQVLSGYTVHYLVVEEGVYNVGDHGIKMEAVLANSTQTAHSGNWLLENRSYAQAYTNPVVLGQIMSDNNAAWSSFWAAGDARANPPDANNFSAGKHVAQDVNTSRTTEQIGYIVLEEGSGQLNGISYRAGLGADIVQGVDDNTSGYTYSFNSLTDASVAILGNVAEDGGDGKWPVLFGNNAVNESQINLAVDEDQITDTERNHTTEQVAYLVMDKSESGPESFCYQEISGELVIEAEHYSAKQAGTGNASGVDWVEVNDATASNGLAMEAAPNTGTWTGLATNGPRLDYNLDFTTTGTYRLWVRGSGPSSSDDSFHAGLDGNPLTTNSGYGISVEGPWRWVAKANGGQYIDINISSPGIHTLNIWMREDGVLFDKLVLRLGTAEPSGTGPVESALQPCDGSAPNQPPTALFQATPESGTAPLQVDFDATASFDSDGNIIAYDWDFGDGATGSGINVSHTYSTPGSYQAILTVTDDGLLTATETVDINASDPNGDCFQEAGGEVVMEAENYSSLSAGTGNAASSVWQLFSDGTASGGAAMETSPNTGVWTGLNTNGPRLDYEINFTTTGTYRVWVRGAGPTNNDDSFHAGLDGVPYTNSGGYGMSVEGPWRWVASANGQYVDIPVTTAGTHTLNIWMREDGVQVDKIVMRTTTSKPTGTGPSESLRGNCPQSVIPVEAFRHTVTQPYLHVESYPNPFDSHMILLVSSQGIEQVQIEVYNALGKLIQRKANQQPNEAIQLGRSWAKGIYFIQVSGGNKIQTLKVLRQ